MGFPATVLVIDDDPDFRSMVGEELSRAGFGVTEAEGGEQGVQALHNADVDVILLDLQMPGTDGFGVLNYIQKTNKDFPVILLSGLPPDQIQKSIKRLSNRNLPPLLLKPVDPNQLLNIIAMRLTGELPS